MGQSVESKLRALQPIIGKWIAQGETVASEGVPAMEVATSDVYEWAPGHRLSCTRPTAVWERATPAGSRSSDMTR